MIKLADTLAPMADFPAVMAEHTEFADGESLQEKLDNGSLGGDGASYKQLSQAEYDALTEDEKMDGREYRTYDIGHIYKLGVEYGKDAYFTSLSQLGLATPSTVGEVFVAMPDKSMLMLNVEAIVDDGTNVLTVTDVPKEFGVLTIEKHASGRHRIEYSSSLGGSASDVRKWIGSIKGNDGTDLRWIELTGSAKIYTTMAQLGLDGSTATVQDVMDAISVGEIAMLRSDAFNNNNWQTQCNGIQWGYLKIEKTQNGLSNIELQEVVAPNRRYFGTQSSGKFVGWVSNTDAKGLAYNSQYYKIDITKGNASWNGVVKFSFNNGTIPTEITFMITSSEVFYTVTEGVNCIKSVTYTINSANVIIGVELNGVVYGTQLLEVNEHFCTINNLTGEQFTGDKVATFKGCDEKTITSLSELGLTADATFQDVVDKLPKGGSALLGVTEFTNYQTIFPYEEGNDQFGRVYIVKGTADGSRMYARWFRKDGVKEAIAKFSINTNKFDGWQEITTKEILHTSLSGNLAGITTVLDLVNALLTEYRALSSKKPVRFISGEITKNTLTDFPVTYGVLQITVAGWDVVEVRLAHSANGFKSMYYGFLTRISGQELISSITWEKVATTTITELSQLGLTSSATLNDVYNKLDVGQTALLSVQDFNDYQTLFPYSVDGDKYARVEIHKGASTAHSRVMWFLKNGSRMALGNVGSDNTIVGWVEYTTKSYVDSKHKYSTNEVAIGTWIDGKTIYRKTFTKSPTSDQATGNQVTINVATISGLTNVIDIQATAKLANYNNTSVPIYIKIPFSEMWRSNSASASYVDSVYVEGTALKIHANNCTPDDIYYITVEYTK